MSTSCPASPVARRPPDAITSSSSSSCPVSPAVDRVPSHVVADETTGEKPPPEIGPVAVSSGHLSPDRSASALEDVATSSEPNAVTVAASTDGHVSAAAPEESIIDDWEQLLSSMENASLAQFDSQTGIMIFELASDTVPQPTVYDHGFSVVDDTTESSSGFHSSTVEDTIVNESISEVTIDSDFSALNGKSYGQYSTINEFRKNLKRPIEPEDEVINNKIKSAKVDFDSVMSGIDDVSEPSTFSSDTDSMELTESDIYDSIDKIEEQSAYVDSQECEIINLITDSEESDLSEMTESQSESSESSDSNVDSSIDEVLLPDELLDNAFVDLKNECYKKYPRLLEIVNKKDPIFHEYENIFSRKKIIENWTTEFNEKDCPSLNFIFKRERKWQATFRKVFQRFKESITILKYYEKYMEKCVNAQPYIIKKVDGLIIEFQSEKENNLPSLLKTLVGEEDCDSTVQSCSNTIENKLSPSNIFEPPDLNCNMNNTKFINECENKNNEKPNELNMDNLTELQPESFATPTVLSHPVPLPSVPILTNMESMKKLPPSLSLTVQNCPEASDRKAIVLKWNLNINEGDFIEIMCYQIFSYQEISSIKPSSSMWEKLTEVHALPLPMKCKLSFESLKSGQKHYFAIRAVDKYFRLGPFSSVQFIELN